MLSTSYVGNEWKLKWFCCDNYIIEIEWSSEVRIEKTDSRFDNIFTAKSDKHVAHFTLFVFKLLNRKLIVKTNQNHTSALCLRWERKLKPSACIHDNRPFRLSILIPLGSQQRQDLIMNVPVFGRIVNKINSHTYSIVAAHFEAF